MKSCQIPFFGTVKFTWFLKMDKNKSQILTSFVNALYTYKKKNHCLKINDVSVPSFMLNQLELIKSYQFLQWFDGCRVFNYLMHVGRYSSFNLHVYIWIPSTLEKAKVIIHMLLFQNVEIIKKRKPLLFANVSFCKMVWNFI